MPIYTKTGDAGQTRLLFGKKVSKTDPRCEAYGTTDQAVSMMGLSRALSQDEKVKEILLEIQRDMFIVGAELATDHDSYPKLEANFSVVSKKMVDRIETLIDDLDSQIDLPNAFIIPGASAASSSLDVARSLIRSGERRVVSLHEQGLLINSEVLRYLNRLADLLFMLARFEDRSLPFEVLTGNAVTSQADQ